MTTPLVKLYRYRVPTEQASRFLDIQKRADWIYRKHVDYRVAHLQSPIDPAEWTEIHWYATQQALETAERLAEKEPQLAELFEEFLRVLDPLDTRIREERLMDRSIR